MKNKTVLYIFILSLCSLSCNEKKKKDNISIHKIEFVNQAGYIILSQDSILNNTYLELEPDCTHTSWVHVIKNKNMPGRKKIDSLLRGHNDSICYLLIRYPVRFSLAELDSIESVKDLKLGPNKVKKSLIEKIGKNEFVIVNDYITDQNKLPIDSSIASYQSISATNNISISYLSNMYNVAQFQNRFRCILKDIEYKLDRNKLDFRTNNIDSFVLAFNKMNQIK